MVLLLIVGAAVCLSGGNRSARTVVPRATAAPKVHTVQYEADGDGRRVSLTYENAQGGSEQTEYHTPWRKTLTDVPTGQFVYLSAQNQTDSGTITCRIYVDGTLWRESESSGAYVIATCSGSVGSQ